MANITYVGGNVTDWNTEIDRNQLSSIASIEEEGGKETNFTLREDAIFKITSGASQVYLYLYAGIPNLFDKNTENPNQWEIKENLGRDEEVTKSFQANRRPGGGATNNAHTAGTLAKSTELSLSLELLVLNESKSTGDALRSELLGNDFSYYGLKPFRCELDNINFSYDGRKIGYTSLETKFSKVEKKNLENRLNQRCKGKSDFLVVNSVKDVNYLSALLEWYDNHKNRQTLVAAVTSSMLKQREKGLDVEGLVARSDIYASNIEEFYDLLKDRCFNHIGGWEELKDSDLYRGMTEILNQQKGNGKKGRVYVTYGEKGALVMDSEGFLYFQSVSGVTSPTQKSPVVDLNGAGDAFTGAMTFLEVEGKYDVLEILKRSNAAAQICIRNPGANQENMITDNAITDFINEWQQKNINNILRYYPGKGWKN